MSRDPVLTWYSKCQCLDLGCIQFTFQWLRCWRSVFVITSPNSENRFRKSSPLLLAYPRPYLSLTPVRALKATVVIDSQTSDPFVVLLGVKQGYVQAPVIFNLFLVAVTEMAFLQMLVLPSSTAWMAVSLTFAFSMQIIMCLDVGFLGFMTFMMPPRLLTLPKAYTGPP